MGRRTLAAAASVTVALGATLVLGTSGAVAGASSAAAVTVKSCDVSTSYNEANPITSGPTKVPVVLGPASHTPVVLPFTKVCALPSGSVGDAKKTYTIGLALPSTSNTWFTGLEDSVLLAAKQFPNVKVTVLAANLDATAQAQDIQTLVAQKVNAIITDPLTVNGLNVAMEQAKNAGIPVIDVDRIASTSKAYTSLVTGDFAQGAAAAADWTVQYLKKKYGKPEGIVDEIQAQLGSSPQIIRKAAFGQVVSKYPGIKIIGLQDSEALQALAYTETKELAPAHPKIDVVYCQSEESCIGAYQALAALGRAKQTAYVGVDLDKTGIQWLQEGKLQALVGWTPFIGDVALRVALRDVTGKPFPKVVWLPDEPTVTKANLSQYSAFAYGPVPSPSLDSLWPIGKIPAS
jgi:ABC-type sugar transport system substrate-binding protein